MDDTKPANYLIKIDKIIYIFHKLKSKLSYYNMITNKTFKVFHQNVESKNTFTIILRLQKSYSN